MYEGIVNCEVSPVLFKVNQFDAYAEKISQVGGDNPTINGFWAGEPRSESELLEMIGGAK